MRVFLNAGNLTASGPGMILRNLLPPLLDEAPDWEFFALLPHQFRAYDWSLHPNLTVSYTNGSLPRHVRRLIEIFVTVPRLCRRLKVDVCLTLGNIGPVRLPSPHIVLLHHSYLLDDSKRAVKTLPMSARLTNAYARWHFRRMVRNCCRVVVQTPVMASAVNKSFGPLKGKVTVIPSTIPDEVRERFRQSLAQKTSGESVNRPVKLVFLAAHYWHKNHRILPAVVKELGELGILHQVRFLLTFDEATQGGRELKSELAEFRDTITNLGPVSYEDVPELLATSDALFLPTLMESFGLIYLEAMAAGLPILTSDRDFSRWICGDLARYFDPESARSIASVISDFIKSGADPSYAQRSAHRLNEFPSSWKQIARSYRNLIAECAG